MLFVPVLSSLLTGILTVSLELYDVRQLGNAGC